MATLRDPLFGLENAPTQAWQDAEARPASSLRGGFEAGRLGTDINALAADEAALRARGDPVSLQQAATLRSEAQALQRRQAAVAPRVGRLEDINGVGDAASWAAGQVGQGAASMLEPVGAAAALAGAARAASIVPGTPGRVGKAVGQAASLAVPYGMNQRQLTGEFANAAFEDPELMARTSAQELNRRANLYGAGAAVLDTALPGLVGHQLTGGGLRKGLSKVGVLPKTALGMGLEGATEAGQEFGKQQVLGDLNPNRDASGDRSALINSFAGGAVGGGPFAAAGAAADAGFRRAGATADAIGTKTGELLDLAKDKTAPAIDAAKDKVGDTIDLFRGGAAKASVPKILEIGRQRAVDLKASATTPEFTLSDEERGIINPTPPDDVLKNPDPAVADAWFAQSDAARAQLIYDRLSASEDPAAQAIAARLDGPDQALALDEGAKYISDRAEQSQLVSRAERKASVLGQLAGAAAKTVGKAAGAAGRAALDVGKAAVSGAKEGAKKNAQASPYDEWAARASGGPVAADSLTADIQAKETAAGAARREKQAASRQRAEVFGESLAAATKEAPGMSGEAVVKLMRETGYRLSQLADSFAEGKVPAYAVSRVGNDLRVALGPKAAALLTSLESVADPKTKPLFDQLRAEIAEGGTQPGRQKTQQLRAATANKLLMLLPPEQAREIVASGSQNELLEHIEDFADGHVTPQLRAALEEAVGKDVLQAMVAEVNVITPETEKAEVVAEPVDAQEQKAAEKNVAKGKGKKVYGVARSPVLRDDPFAPNKRASREERLQFMDEERQRRAEGLEPRGYMPVERPRLFTADQDDQVASRIKQMEGRLDVGHTVAAQSAWEAMKDMPVSQRLAIFRDYLQMDAAQGDALAERRAATVGKALLDEMDGASGGERKSKTFRLNAGMRAKVAEAMEKYFSERRLVVAESMTDRDLSAITVIDVQKMADRGAKDIEYARSPKSGDTRKPAEIINEANLIVFQSTLANKKNQGKEGDKPGPLYIRANELVDWVRQQRERGEVKVEESDFSNRNKNEQFVADVSEGIAIMLASGLVEPTMPHKTNKFGKVESFAQGIPPSLQLVTSDYGAMEFGKAERAKKRKVEDPEPASQEAVAADQARDESMVSAQDPDAEGVDPYTLWGDVKEIEKAAKSTDRKRLKSAVEESNDKRVGRHKTTADDATPLDFFPKLKAGDVPDDFADAKHGSKDVTAGLPAEPKMSAWRMAGERADAMMETFRTGGTAAGMEAIERRLRMAAKDVHFAFPLPRLLNPKVMSQMDLSPEQAQRVVAARKELIALIAASDVSADRKAQMKAQLTQAAPEVAAPAVPKSQGGAQRNAQRAGPGFTLRERGPYTAKDQLKADKATAFIGNGSPQSSTRAYRNDAKAAGIPVNAGNYTAADVVFVSAEGARSGRWPPDEKEISKAMAAGAKIITDNAANRARPYNVGEREVAEHLAKGGYTESAPGEWTPKRKLNQQGGSLSQATKVASDEDIAEAKAYVKKVLGDKVRVEFEKAMGHSAEWVEAANLIKISTTAAAGTMQAAYHEALHAFFSKYVKGSPRVVGIMKSLTDDAKLMERVVALLAKFPAAQAQLVDGEERLAYIYQFWAAGLLDIGPSRGRTWLQKLARAFRGVFGLVKDSERAQELLQAFHEGKLSTPSLAGQAIAAASKPHWTVKARRKMDALVQRVAALTMPAESILLTSASPEARLLGREFFANPGDEDAAEHGEGYLNARRRESNRYHSLFGRAVQGLSSRDLKEVATHLQRGTEPTPANIPYEPQRAAVERIRQSLDHVYRYMKDRGVDVGYIEKYYPVVWSLDALVDKRDEFIDMLVTKYADKLDEGIATAKSPLTRTDAATRIWQALVQNKGGDNRIAPVREDGVLIPFFESGEARVLDWIKGEDRERFLEKNLIAQLSRYFHESTRRAEYTSRFGKDGSALAARLVKISSELQQASHEMLKAGEFADNKARERWVERQVRDVRHSVGAMEGTLGKDISPTWRKFNSWMTVYQNVRLLPLALFSSLVDPLGIVARGGEMKDAYEAFLTGMKGVVRTWGNAFRDEPKLMDKDDPMNEWAQLAEFVGATEAEIFSHFIADEYSSTYMSPAAKAINDKMFVFNGMEAWNRSMRIAGTKAAVMFLQKHKSLPDKNHSARWLKELGLEPADILLDVDGKLITDKTVLVKQGVDKSKAEEQMRRIHWAINRWVEGAVLTPNAAQRPAWSSDPRYGIIFHLKQFTYSFHQTLIKRAVREAEHGNMVPLGTFAWYIPMMLASNITRGLIQGGGELPAHMKGMDLGDHLWRATQNAGGLGIGQIGVDAGADIASIGGPAVEQFIDALRDPLDYSTIRALPLHGIYKESLT